MKQPYFLVAAGLLLPCTYSVAAPALYVNNLSLTGDIYTTAIGSDVTGTGSSSAPFATVAAALRAADATTTTIYIDAGTYSERVVLDKNISLQGAGRAIDNPGAATIFNGGLAASSAQTQETGIYIATPGSGSVFVKISKLTVRNYDYGIQTYGSSPLTNFVLEDVEAVSNRQHGIFWNALAGTSNITFRRVRAAQNALPPNTNTNGAGRGLFVVNGHKQNILVEDSQFEQNRRGGLDINDGSVSGLVIRNNRFTLNAGAALAILGAAGQRGAGGTYTTIAALIENNLIRDNPSNGMELKACTGSGLGAGPGSFVVRGNYIARGLGQPQNIGEDNAGIAFLNRDRGIINAGGGLNGDLTTGGAFIQSNTVRGYLADAFSSFFGRNGFGVVLEGSNNKVFNNVIARCQYGVQVQDIAAAPLLNSPLFDIDRNTPLVSVNDSIRQNRLDTCTTALRGINLSNVVEAGLNWLGNSTFLAVRGTSGSAGAVVTLGAPGGFPAQSAFEPTGFITYSPFLNSRTDASAAAGFQGDLSFLNVDRFCPTPGPVACLQKGVDFVTENGTVYMSAEVYNQSVVITKNLTLTNTGAPTTIQNVTLNSLGKVLTLGSPVSITGALTLNSGLISSTATNLLTLTNTATSSAGNANSFVSGPMQKNGNSAFVFPLGKGSTWARLGISAPATAATSFLAEYFAASYPSAALAGALTSVSRVEYWNLARTAGTDNVTVRLFWEDGTRSGITFSPKLQVARFDGTAWNTEGNGGLDGSAPAGSVASAAAVSQFSPFTFASLPPLPVELVRFQAAAAPNGVVDLRWATASERDNKGFGLERSLDGQLWQQLAFVPGQGSTLLRQEYRYADRPGTFGRPLYYRLRQQDMGGRSTYSSVATVVLAASDVAGTLTLHPNPASPTDQVTLGLSRPLGSAARLLLLDLTGRLVMSQPVPANATETTLTLPDELAAGTYLVQLTGTKQFSKPTRLVRK
ncbi:Por secretion system C-terminal sorting domain-containing protein [Hymenobacter gelipurpurascens]|uniref:Por secretion system C-terminal sorting domain-containing protein n=1 Tax=Hymenobacter gelipurpurascens TaxID=89968 RepID=A0A212TP90_9BACT|nr:right-handed parallel beta-helix repeat-containing protein [Hymenobacter gelipurpurascens]SNC67805.1 Por secretion system C-terminal sorting domain-containing protein [Hymenobacter gelipurpurascens]